MELLWIIAALIVAIIGGIIGWIAHGDDERRYAAALRYADPVPQLEPARVEAERIATAPVVVNLHLAPALYPAWPQSPVLATQVVPALEVGQQ